MRNWMVLSKTGKKASVFPFITPIQHFTGKTSYYINSRKDMGRTAYKSAVVFDKVVSTGVQVNSSHNAIIYNKIE